jgi:hypothetical protein
VIVSERSDVGELGVGDLVCRFGSAVGMVVAMWAINLRGSHYRLWLRLLDWVLIFDDPGMHTCRTRWCHSRGDLVGLSGVFCGVLV